jgi:hypothetical protein
MDWEGVFFYPFMASTIPKSKEGNMGRWLGLVVIAVVAVFAWIGEGTASAKDIRFIAQEAAPERAIWAPSAVMIDQKNDLKEPLFFILENPTGTDHDFAVNGLYEILPEKITSTLRADEFRGPYSLNVLKPIHVLVKAKSALKILVSNEGLAGDRDLGSKYLFFCPTHKDAHLGGVIFVD